MRISMADYASLFIIAALFVLSASIYSSMPEQMPVHWNIRGEADSFSPKSVALFLFPSIIAGLYMLMLFLPGLAVFRQNIEKSGKSLDGLKLALILFFSVVYIATLLPSFGLRLSLSFVMPLSIAALFYYLGHIMMGIKRNYFFGIRTPWTLSDDFVWEKTHWLGSLTFRLNGILLLLGLLGPAVFFWVLISSVLLNVLLLFGYSYWLWKGSGKQL